MYSIVINKLIRILYGLRLFKFNKNPLLDKPYPESLYEELYFKTISTPSKTDLVNFEKEYGYQIDTKWINDLALHTQIVVKHSNLNFDHGRVVYSVLRKYLNKNDKDKFINIIETGTARGFSSLCLAKALHDHGREGKILTYDLLPHLSKIYWNCIDDNEGKKTRSELLHKWKYYTEKYILFINGESSIELERLQLERIHFAFLDGEHTYDKLLFELRIVEAKQISGDIIIIDDYNNAKFDQVVKATKLFIKKFNYSIRLINTIDNRYEAILVKI